MNLSIIYERRVQEMFSPRRSKVVQETRTVVLLDRIAREIGILVGTTDVNLRYIALSLGGSTRHVLFTTHFPSFEVPMPDEWVLCFFMYRGNSVWHLKKKWDTTPEEVGRHVAAVLGMKLIPHLARIGGKLDTYRLRLEHAVRLEESR